MNTHFTGSGSLDEYVYSLFDLDDLHFIFSFFNPSHVFSSTMLVVAPESINITRSTPPTLNVSLSVQLLSRTINAKSSCLSSFPYSIYFTDPLLDIDLHILV